MNDTGLINEPDRQQLLSDARRRLLALEAEAHRLRAQLAKLEAAGEEAEAEKLEEQLARLNAEQQTERVRIGEAPTATGFDLERAAAAAAAEANQLAGVAPRQPVGGEPSRNRSRPSREPQLTPLVAERPELTSPDADHDDKEQPHRPPAARRRNAPALATSLGVHAAVLALLSLWTIATLQEQPPMLLGSAPDGEEFIDELVEVDFSATELDPAEFELQEFELEPTEILELEPTEITEPWEAAAAGLTDLTPGLTASLPTDAASLLLGESGGKADGGRSTGERRGGGAPGSARFFGAKSKGNRFVFVVDNSGTMKDGRMETTLMELQRAVGAMKAEQEFYVLFFSDQAYPMFYPDSVEEMMPATRDNKRRLGGWLQTVEICNGGRMADAMKMAAELDPGVVYLLSDGDMGGSTRDFMTADHGWGFVVHTLGMTVRNQEDAGNLIAIARANGGSFTPVGINPVAARLAEQRPIRQHRTPGKVWGTKVRGR